jgi:F-type H+-transporting ATPase subunit b
MTPVVADASLLEINATFVVEIIAFVVMVLVLGKYAYPRIMRVAEDRQRRIEEGVKAAEESKQRLAEVQQDVQRTLEEARGQAREIISRAHRDAAGEAEEVRIKGRADAEAVVRQAQEEIRAERDRAIQELRAEMSSLIVDAAGRLIGQTLDQRAHQRLIDESLTRVAGGSDGNGRRG